MWRRGSVVLRAHRQRCCEMTEIYSAFARFWRACWNTPRFTHPSLMHSVLTPATSMMFTKWYVLCRVLVLLVQTANYAYIRVLVPFGMCELCIGHVGHCLAADWPPRVHAHTHQKWMVVASRCCAFMRLQNCMRECWTRWHAQTSQRSKAKRKLLQCAPDVGLCERGRASACACLPIQQCGAGAFVQKGKLYVFIHHIEYWCMYCQIMMNYMKPILLMQFWLLSQQCHIIKVSLVKRVRHICKFLWLFVL